ncbi:hypothetical protein GOV09_01790 [Candidatus Woesearchaeota archaeon]|nr:hypothetical protein [Candidatus Woesearchaeota archaeon]
MKKILLLFLFSLFAVSASALTITDTDVDSLHCGESTVLTIHVENEATASIAKGVRITAVDPELGLFFEEFDGGSITLEPGDGLSLEVIIETDESLQHGTYIIDVALYEDKDSPEDSKTVELDVICNESMLRFTDIDVQVGSKTDKNLHEKADGYDIDRDAEPGDRLDFDVEVENTFKDLEIEDVVMEITIMDFDDDDDVDDETSEEDIKAGNDELFKLDFDVPIKIDEGDYTIIIEIEGEDEIGRKHRLVKRFVLNVDKESHNVVISKADLSNPFLGCERKTELDVTVLNLGSDEEEEIRITVENSELAINKEEFKDGRIDLETGTDANAEYTAHFSINVEDASPGSYTLDIGAFRDEIRLEDTEKINLDIRRCIDEVFEEEEESVVVVVDKTQTKSPPRDTLGLNFLYTIIGILLLGLVVFIIGALLIKAK